MAFSSPAASRKWFSIHWLSLSDTIAFQKPRTQGCMGSDGEAGTSPADP